MNSTVKQPSNPDHLDIGETATFMAKRVIEGFVAHDNGDYDGAVEAFYDVDRHQFPQLADDDIRLASIFYVDALFEKDEVEFQHLRGGGMDTDTLREADWTPVRKKFRMRAGVIGMDSRYALASTDAWRNHKVGGDYWGPIQEAQAIEIRAAIGDPDYPSKPKYGQSGYGPEPARYALAIELHDMHEARYVSQAVTVMEPYFEFILEHHYDES